ncbi:amino acid adenylation domain-containing protein [Xanthomonas sp. NCPPB 2632]|uniref:non-ribosomal peptide synthetase n=1 Tax=Xanthomonas sp. NCPPB 2632 TaxID=3240912 RepID=UPI00351990BB
MSTMETEIERILKSMGGAEIARLRALGKQRGVQQQDDASYQPIPRIARSGHLPPSSAQQRMWFLAQMDGVSASYHVPWLLRIRGDFDRAAWQAALDGLWARHEALRSIFVPEDGKPWVKILPGSMGIPMEHVDLRGSNDVEGVLRAGCDELIRRPFDLGSGPLVRAGLYTIDERDVVFLLVKHHIVSDGWSFGVMLKELRSLYVACCTKRVPELPALPVQYPDYAAWQRQRLGDVRLVRQADYWRSVLRDAPERLDLPTDRPRSPRPSFEGAVLPVALDAGTSRDIRRLAQAHGASPFMTVLAAWAVVLSRLSGQNDLVIGTPSANRSHPEIARLIGYFVNTLALRVDLSGSPRFSELLARVRRTTLDAQMHQDLPFERVVELVHPMRQRDHSPLFQVICTWQDGEGGEWDLPGLDVAPLRAPYDKIKFDLNLTLGEVDGCLVGGLSYSTSLFDEPSIRRHIGYLKAVLGAISTGGDPCVDGIPLIDDDERRIVEAWNDTAAALPAAGGIHERFHAVVAAQPELAAIVCGSRRLTYRQLDALARRISLRLGDAGVGVGDRVATLLERSVELVAVQLAVLERGAAYVPLDPEAPASRTLWMVGDSAATVVVTRDRPGMEWGIPVVDVDAMDDVDEVRGSPVAWMTGSELAYVMYTSGSTGLPKGVMIEHRSVLNLALHSDYAPVSAGDVVACAANPAFDASTFEVWGTLLRGGTLAILDRDTVLEPDRLAEAITTQDISVMFLTTSLFNRYVERIGKTLSSMRYLVCGGEEGSRRAFDTLLSFEGRVRLVNGYGPTECTTFATTHEVTRPLPESAQPIGRPLPNVRIHLLDASGASVPIGAPGEICIAGLGVARGYLHRHGSDREVFASEVSSREPAARMYRTGDLARYLPDGNLVFLGRGDDQVKIRGFRVEPTEVARILLLHPAVAEAAVIATGIHDKRLTAYFSGQTVSPMDLRAHLLGHVPDYMVPAAFVHVPGLPLTAVGKIDRARLPEPDPDAFAQSTFEAPRGHEERLVAQLWSELLGGVRVGRQDSFFALGGHSLLATEWVERARQAGLPCSLNDLFECPTLMDLSARLASVALTQSGARIVRVRDEGSGEPLFFVPTGIGDYSYVFPLARDIHADCPIRVLSWPSHTESFPVSIDELARRMARMMRESQPRGPYRIAGYSSGGILAYAIARSLEVEGQDVAFLGLVDVPAPHTLPMKHPSAQQMFVSEVTYGVASDAAKAAALVQAAGTETLAELAAMARHAGFIHPRLPDAFIVSMWERIHRYACAASSYEAPAVDAIVHHFHSGDRAASMAVSDAWRDIVDVTRLRHVAIPGDHLSMMNDADNRSHLGRAIDAGLDASSAIGARGSFQPLVNLSQGTGADVLFCFPGAGAGVTSMVSLCGALGNAWGVQGLQPRGIAEGEAPFESVEDAANETAKHILESLRTGMRGRRIHLLGHSFGGWMALETALRLEDEGQPIASLTLVDSEAPGVARHPSPDETAIRSEFVSAIRYTLECYFELPSPILCAESTDTFLHELHGRLVDLGMMPSRSEPAMLRGPLAAFTAAMKTAYMPRRPFAGEARLAQVFSPDRALADDTARLARTAAEWKQWVPALKVWHGTGHHFSILKSPHIDGLVDWAFPRPRQIPGDRIHA